MDESPAIFPIFVFGLELTWLAVHQIHQALALKPFIAFAAPAELGRVVCAMRDINEFLDRLADLVPANGGLRLPDRAGHSSVRTTAYIFSHAIRGKDHAAAQCWDEIMQRSRSEAEKSRTVN